MYPITGLPREHNQCSTSRTIKGFTDETTPEKHWADPVVIFDNGGPGNGNNYSDRLHQADSDKYNALCQKHFGDQAQIWDNREPAQTEAFLRDFLDQPDLMLVKIQKRYNRMSGFPIWFFEYTY